MRAIVLSGGGSKGAYEIGVWKALRKLNIEYDIVTGTSVGALNAALMTQKTYFKAVKLWKNIEFNKIIDEKIDENNIVKSYAENIVHGGMNTTSLERTVDEALNLKKFYKSKINMGLITVRLNKLKPIKLTKKEIEPSKLKDYLVASASCFPAFKTKSIEDKKYVDGGYFDNLPINLAIEMGANEIIAVDLKEVGIKRRVDNEEVKIVTISPRNNIGSFLIFEKDVSRRAIKLGYNDTLKHFKKLDGNKYTFKKNNLLKNYEKYSYKFDKLTGMNISFKELNNIIEKLGYIFRLDDSIIYDISKFNKVLIHKFEELEDDKNIVKLLRQNKIKNLFSNEYMVKYIYKTMGKNHLREIHRIFKTEYLCSIYIKVIMEEL